MLNTQSIKAGLTLVQRATGLGATIVAKNGTPIERLVASMRPLEFVNGIGKSTLYANLLTESLVSCSGPTSFGDSPHCVELSQITDAAAASLRNSISILRGTINPMVKDIVTLVESKQNDLDSQSPLNINIEHIDINPVYKHSALEMFINIYRESAGGTVDINNDLSDKITPNNDIDVVKGVLATSNDGFNLVLNELVDDCFNGGMMYSIGHITQPIAGTKRFFTDNSNLITFLYIRGVTSGRHPDIDVASLTMEERAELAKIMAAAGSNLWKMINGYSMLLQSSRMIIADAVNERGLGVLDPVYTKWLANGGNVDQLIAAHAYYKGRGGDLANGFHGGTDGSRWDKEFAALTRSDRVNRNILSSSAVKQVVRTSITDYINGLVDAPRSMYHERLKNAQSLWDFNGDNLQEYIRHCVAMVIDQDSNALEIAHGIDTYGKIDHEMTVGEAAIRSCYAVLAKWIDSQLTITFGPAANYLYLEEPLGDVAVSNETASGDEVYPSDGYRMLSETELSVAQAVAILSNAVNLASSVIDRLVGDVLDGRAVEEARSAFETALFSRITEKRQLAAS